MRWRATRWTTTLLLGCLLVGVPLLLLRARMARAEEPWEAQARQAEAEEDTLLEDARQRGTTRQIVAKYESRLSRQPTALNHYLLGRALYYDKDPARAEQELRQALALQPGFWFARLRLAMLEMEGKRPADAERDLGTVLRQKPQEPRALRLLAELRIDAKDWDRALQVLEELRSLDPADVGVRKNIASVLMHKEDWPAALRELRVLRGRFPQDPAVRWFYAVSLYKNGDLAEASRELEALLRLGPDDLHALDLLREIYARLEDWKSLQRTLERMVPLVDDPKVAAEMKETIRRLAAGERPGPPAKDDTSWPQDTIEAMTQACIEPTNVEQRREALQRYYEAQWPRVPYVLVSRIFAQYEPDAICRSWALRIVGSMQNPQLAQRVAFALRDPDVGVRALAAETIGQLRAPSGVLYLLPTLLATKLPDKAGAPSADGVVRLLNSTRGSLIALTHHNDCFGNEKTWVPLESLAAMRRDWVTWLQSEDGIQARLLAISDLEAQNDLSPELAVLDDVSDPDPRIAKAAYLVLLHRSRLASGDELTTKEWSRFPHFTTDELTPANLGRVRAAVTAWWKAWNDDLIREQNRPKEPDSPAPTGPGPGGR